ncbi:MAG: hypothetical protein MJ091_06940 [Clostridia bacterium]|nr:hypothetical protein [Clostridia bacterium]
MRTTVTLATNLNSSIFEVMAQDIDDVILLINYFVVLGATEGNKENKKASIKHKGKKEERIRVNDKTATGGWF